MEEPRGGSSGTPGLWGPVVSYIQDTSEELARACPTGQDVQRSRPLLAGRSRGAAVVGKCGSSNNGVLGTQL